MSRVLIAEDSRVQAAQCRAWLEEGGYEVTLAENGSVALEMIAAERPDIVLTDMQMPEMNGLELLDRLQFQYPEVPLILMTAHGSESLAMEALQRGAAAYVPKSDVSTMLVATVDQVLGVVRAERGYAGLLSCLTRNEFQFSLDNRYELIGPLGDLIQQMLRALEFGDTIQRVRIGIALEHALLNALYRGNLELTNEQLENDREALMQGEAGIVEQRREEKPYSERRIDVDAQLTRSEARFVIRDQGPGFDISIVPEPADPASLERGGGRGLVLMVSFMDEVQFNEQGNEITLIKRG